MKIAISGSMVFSKEMVEIKNKLEKKGHSIVLPRHTEKYALIEGVGSESAEVKMRDDLIREYYNEINDCDAILIANYRKNSVDSYIGGNAFLEMGFAHVLNKKIFLMQDIPEISYSDEIIAMQPVCLNGDLEKVV